MLSKQEWLETNGLGNVISGTASLVNTRNYHARFALVDQKGDRLTLVNELEFFYKDIKISPTHFEAYPHPQWTFHLEDHLCFSLELISPHGTERVLYRFHLKSGNLCELKIKLWMSGRSYFGVRKTYDSPYEKNNCFSLGKDLPLFHFAHTGTWTAHPACKETYYPLTAERHEEAFENLYSPGEIQLLLEKKQTESYLVFDREFCSCENASQEFQNEKERRLRLGSKIQTTDQRLRAMALGTEHFRFTRKDGKKSILAGFPWFLDWGRDTFISLEGLVLSLGELDEAHEILKNFAGLEKDGLLPNMFPTLGNTPIYNSVDAPLWFIHAAFLSLKYGNDEKRFKTDLWPSIVKIINAYREGTRYNIHMDTKDGLIYAGEEGLQLTWMDAKCGHWVVTPRRGKPIEISALWYAALKNALEYLRKNNEKTPPLWNSAFELLKENFQKRYYSESKEHLKDLLDSPHPEEEELLRPNLLFALSLASDLLSPAVAKKSLAAVEKHLLTPYGLRSLSPLEKNYIGRYEGNLEQRDAAYHQGTVWAFLIGVYIDAKLIWEPHTSKERLKDLLEELLKEAASFSTSHIAEIFDGDTPQRPQGCFAQAWSDAELLRVSKKLGLWYLLK